MYKIIGADQKEYGPVTSDQIRYWIGEGRVNAQTQARAEGTTEWRPLGTFPEFADVLGGIVAAGVSGAPSVLAPADPALGREVALRMVKGPAIGLMVTAILGLVLVVFGLIINVLVLAGINVNFGVYDSPDYQELWSQMSGTKGIIQGVIAGIVGVVVLVGAMKMKALRNYSFAFTASILAMLPCISPCCLIGLPFGIWALVVLNRPEVKSSFGS